jgi:hypothetical protein
MNKRDLLGNNNTPYEKEKCAKCYGTGKHPVDTKTDLEGVSASGICPDCNGTGSEPEAVKLTDEKPAQLSLATIEMLFNTQIIQVVECLLASHVTLAKRSVLQKVIDGLPKMKPDRYATELPFSACKNVGDCQTSGHNEAIAEVRSNLEKELECLK